MFDSVARGLAAVGDIVTERPSVFGPLAFWLGFLLVFAIFGLARV